MTARKMPIGVQDFEKLIKEDYVYVDKTAYIHKLAQGNVYFLSRPRRFGKSLFLSTLKQYFLGNKDIFKGLAIEKLEEENPTAFDGVAWAKHPVIYIDLNSNEFKDRESLEKLLDSQLAISEKKYLGETKEGMPAIRFANLVREASRITGRKAVVLVDEYDKPLLQVLGNENLFDEYRAILKGFYGVLKSEDASLRFSMLTGVTKFSKVSVWSDLNNLEDISLDKEFSEICGITEDELKSQFKPEIEALAKANELTSLECFAKLKKRYDGYHFSKGATNVYNPFSVLNTFKKLEFSDYWFQTGTPTFLVNEIRRNNFDLRKLLDGVDVDSMKLTEASLGGSNPIPILVQSGYLTIKGYDKEFKIYHLELPNEEVKYGFLNFLSPDFIGKENIETDFDIRAFSKDIRSGNVDSFMTRLKSVIASLPYPTDTQGRGIDMLEYNFQIAVHLTFTLMGQFTQTEVHSIKGRADDIRCVSNAVDKFPIGKRSEATYSIVQTADTAYIFEFKTNDTAENALKQINEQGYADKFLASRKKIVKIGAEFSTEKRELVDWKLG